MFYRHKNSTLVLSNGEVFAGHSLAAKGEFAAEIVFNTAMTGYQEVISDPSYKNQIVCFTYPHIGNTGINAYDWQSGDIQVAGIICNSYSPFVSNWQADQQISLAQVCQQANIPLLTSVDTRKLSILLRENGSLGALISARDDADQTSDHTETNHSDQIQKAKKYNLLSGLNLVETVQKHTAKNKGYVPKQAQPNQPTIAVLDLGIKDAITKNLEQVGLAVEILPYDTPPQSIIAKNYSGILLSNGPGDPRDYPDIIKNTTQLIEHSKKTKLPIFGICLGCQFLALASGGKITKMKFGHHGINHPIKGLLDNAVTITSQNHNYCIDQTGIPAEFDVTHISLFDQSIQAISHQSAPIQAVQGHPEAGPGPRDAHYFFNIFAEKVTQYKQTQN